MNYQSRNSPLPPLPSATYHPQPVQTPNSTSIPPSPIPLQRNPNVYRHQSSTFQNGQTIMHEPLNSLMSPQFNDSLELQSTTTFPIIPSTSLTTTSSSTNSAVSLAQTSQYEKQTMNRIPSGVMEIKGVTAAREKVQEFSEQIIPELIGQVLSSKDDNKREFDNGIDYLTKQIDRVQTLHSDYLVPAWFANISTLYRLKLPDGVIPLDADQSNDQKCDPTKTSSGTLNESQQHKQQQQSSSFGRNNDLESQLIYSEEVKSYLNDLEALSLQSSQFQKEKQVMGTVHKSIIEPHSSSPSTVITDTSGSNNHANNTNFHVKPEYGKTVLTLDNFGDCCEKMCSITFEGFESKFEIEIDAHSSDQTGKSQEITHIELKPLLNEISEINNKKINKTPANSIKYDDLESIHLESEFENVEDIENIKNDVENTNRNVVLPTIVTPKTPARFCDTLLLSQNSKQSSMHSPSTQQSQSLIIKPISLEKNINVVDDGKNIGTNNITQNQTVELEIPSSSHQQSQEQLELVHHLSQQLSQQLSEQHRQQKESKYSSQQLHNQPNRSKQSKL